MSQVCYADGMKLLRRIAPDTTDAPTAEAILSAADPIAAASERYRTLRDRRAELGAEDTGLRDEALELARDLSRRAGYGEDFAAAKRAAQVARIAGLPAPTPVHPQDYRERQSQIAERRALLKAAIDELDRELISARAEASAVIRDLCKPAHDAAARALALAARDFYNARRNYEALIGPWNDHGIAWSTLGPAHPRFAPLDTVESYLIECWRAGHLSRDELPDTKRTRQL